MSLHYYPHFIREVSEYFLSPFAIILVFLFVPRFGLGLSRQNPANDDVSVP